MHVKSVSQRRPFPSCSSTIFPESPTADCLKSSLRQRQHPGLQRRRRWESLGLRRTERERERPTKPLKLLSLVFHRLQRVRERIRSQRQRGFREKKNSRRKGAADTFCLPLRSSGKTRKYQYSATPSTNYGPALSVFTIVSSNSPNNTFSIQSAVEKVTLACPDPSWPNSNCPIQT